MPTSPIDSAAPRKSEAVKVHQIRQVKCHKYNERRPDQHGGSRECHSSLSAWTRSRPPTQVTPAPRWAWPILPKCCGTSYLSHNPGNPEWVNRDRFVLSNGHGSMLLYSLLHLDRLRRLSHGATRNFRQIGYRPPDIRNTSRADRSRQPQAHWGRASAMPSAWRWLRKCWRRSLIGRATTSSITKPGCFLAMAA